MQSIYYKEPRYYFAGRMIWPWRIGSKLIEPKYDIYRLSSPEDYKGDWWFATLSAFLEQLDAGLVSGLSIPETDFTGYEVIFKRENSEALTQASTRLRNLTALFLGDHPETSDVICQYLEADITSLLTAYPALEHLGIRGNLSPGFGQQSHECLKTLIIETGNLEKTDLQQVLASHFPALTHLELWLGYDSPTEANQKTLADLQPLLDGKLFPNLRYLGLRNSLMTNEIASALTDAPILKRLHTLDLSLGTMNDHGAQALLENPLIRHLKKLDLHYHNCSPEMMGRLQALDLIVDSAMPQDPELTEWIAVFEY